MSKKTPFVIDSGEFSVKSGLAGEEVLTGVLPSLVGRPRVSWAQRATLKQEDVVAGSKACSLDPLKYDIRSPISRGVVNNWDDMELLWRQVYENSATNSTDRPLLLAEVPGHPVRSRANAAEILFEKLQVSSVHFVPQAVLSLYSVGMTSGLVLDCGEGMSHAVPVYQGCLLRQGMFSSELGGADVTSHLHRQLRREGFDFAASSARDILRKYKETECYVATRGRSEEEVDYDKTSRAKGFKLPDGTGTIPLGMERFRAPDVLFSPSTIGLECASVQGLVVQAMHACDLTLRKDLFQMLCFAGGSTMLKGFGERFLYELRRMVPKDVKIKISTPPRRDLCAWVGGSILASLPTFDRMAVTKAEFQEHGGRAFQNHMEAYFKELNAKADIAKFPGLSMKDLN